MTEATLDYTPYLSGGLPSDINIVNQAISSNQYAVNSITTSGVNYNIGVTELRAGKKIVLSPYFKATNGFSARIVNPITTCASSNCPIKPNAAIGSSSTNQALPILTVENETLDFEIYPNPNSGIFTVKVDSKFINGQLFIYDIAGRVVYQSKLSREIANVASEFAEGVYFVTLLKGEEVISKKMIVK